MNMQRFTLKNRGLGLIQILLSIAVSAAIALVAVRYYSEVKESQKITALWQQVVTITNAVTQCISTLKPGQSTTTSSIETYCESTSNLKKAGYLTGDSFTNPWTGSNGLGVSQISGTTVFKVWIGAGSVPSLACNKLNLKAQSSYSITQGGTTYTAKTYINGSDCDFNIYITQ